MRGLLLSLALLGLAACAADRGTRRAFDDGEHTPFFESQLAGARAPSPSTAPSAPRAEDGLKRLAETWKGIAAAPSKQVRLVDLSTKEAASVLSRAATSEGLDALLASPSIATVLPAVYQRNSRIKAALRVWRATLSRYGQAAAYDDVLRQYNAWTKRSVAPVGTPPGRESIAGSIPFPGMRGELGTVATLDARIARDRYLETVNAVLTDARMVVHKLRYLDAAIAITSQHRKAVDSQSKVADTRYRSGTGQYVDVLKASTELAEVDDQLLSLRQSRKAAAVALNTLIERKTDGRVGAPASVEIPHAVEAEGLAERVLQSALEVSRTSAGIDRMRAMLRMSADRSYYKTLQRHYFFDVRQRPAAEPDRAGPAKDEQPRRMPAMDASSGFVEAHLAELRTHIKAAESGLDAVRQKIRRKVESMYFRFDEARRRALLHKSEIIPKAKQTLAAAETAYQGGKLPFISMVDAQRRLLRAQLGLQMATRQAADARAELEMLGNQPIPASRK